MIFLAGNVTLVSGRSRPTVDDVTGPILYLAFDLATFIIGEVLHVSDGLISCG